MKLRNRLTALALAGMMMTAGAAETKASAYEDKVVTIDGVTYKIYHSDDGGGFATAGHVDTAAESISIPDQLEGLDTNLNLFGSESPFSGCTKLKSLTVPDVSFCRYGYLTGCDALETVIFRNDTEGRYRYADGVVYDRDVTLLYYCNIHNETEYEVPATVKYVNDYAFCHIFTTDTKLSKITFLNPDCYIPDNMDFGALGTSLTICGYDDSTAYDYAMSHNRSFVSLGAYQSTSSPSNGMGYAPADLNGDGSINAADATLILMYAAYVGAGGTDDIMTFVAEQ